MVKHLLGVLWLRKNHNLKDTSCTIRFKSVSVHWLTDATYKHWWNVHCQDAVYNRSSVCFRYIDYTTTGSERCHHKKTYRYQVRVWV